MPGPVTDPRAHELRHRYQQRFGGPDYPVPVESIARDLLGLDVVRVPMDCSGMIVPAQRRIFVRDDEPEARQRFTIAHELGHWVCQCVAGSTEAIYCRPIDLETATDRAREREANVFAAELLMPEDAVRAASENTFGVSELAYRWRLYSFGLGSAPTEDL